ncbi:hypothetical protein AVEN_273038-1 [Araneus ventricosus]|uniref:Uncharacterized protein n=1 Tax=Araneus ventricosus TaxID=182803 RepID=A0A4Y2PXE7_ARAVE|nr:hypothetical protein AVEN_273038-1 [Araneus ventricosus]
MLRLISYPFTSFLPLPTCGNPVQGFSPGYGTVCILQNPVFGTKDDQSWRVGYHKGVTLLQPSAFELALRGHDEREVSLNTGDFRGLINFLAELDSSLKDHLTSATVSKGTSKEIQNDLLDCMLTVCQRKSPQRIAILDETVSERIPLGILRVEPSIQCVNIGSS